MGKAKKKEKPRGAKGEGSLFKRGRFWWFKAPNGERFPTRTQIKSEATDFKLRKLAELRTGQPHIVSKAKGTTVNELLDAHLAYMRRKNRKSTTDVEQVLKLHVRPYFGERFASTLGTSDFEQYRKDKAPVQSRPRSQLVLPPFPSLRVSAFPPPQNRLVS